MRATISASRPPSFLQLAGHPLRWQLLAELAGSDRTVRDLTARSGEPQNLVSYHLGKLRRAGLVSSRRSSADGRDAYYRVHLDRFGSELAAAGAGLHPGLGSVAGPRGEQAATGRVLFLCTGNSARSPMAEALLRHRSGGTVEAESAGSQPKGVHPDAVRVMADRYGIDVHAHRPKHLDEFAGQAFDRVITLCDKVREVCPERPGTEPVHWSTADPSATASAGDDGVLAAFAATAAELDERIGFLLAELSPEPVHR